MLEARAFQGKGIYNKEGIILFIVLGTIFIVIILANIILTTISSQSRLTHHQLSRIQAYYALRAGMNYAIEKLRVGNDPTNWPAPGPNAFYTHNLCDSAQSGCSIGAGDIDEPGLPQSIQLVKIVVAGRGANVVLDSVPVGGCDPCTPTPGIDICICTKATYSYTP